MFSMRVISRDGSEASRRTGCSIRFDGIRTQDKFKWFLMTDVMTFFIYKQLSENYFANRSGEDEREHLAEIVKISKSVSLLYAGNPSGTPADQISKRAENMVSAIRGESQKHKESAVFVNQDNVESYRRLFGKDPQEDQMAVRLSLPGSTLYDLIHERFSYSGGVPGYVAAGDFIRWFISDILEASRNEDSLQTILKVQYDTVERIFSDKIDAPEGVKFAIARVYLAMSCLLYGDIDSMGDVYEPVVRYASFKSVLPSFRLPPRTSNLIVMTSGNYEGNVDEGFLSDVFDNVIVCYSPVDTWDQELMLYKARKAIGFKPYNMLILDDGVDSMWIDSLISCLQKMKWSPIHMALTSDANGVFRIPFNHSVLEIHGKTDEEVIEDVRSLYQKGIHSSDRYAEAILRSTYRDLLTVAYPDIAGVIDSYPKRANCVKLLGGVREYVSDNEPCSDYPHKELVKSVVELVSE